MSTSSDVSVPSLGEIFTQMGFGRLNLIVMVTLGFIQFFISSEQVSLAFLGHILKCAWNISLFEISFIPISDYFGVMLGSLYFGKMTDVHGRKIILITTSLGMFYFCLLCAASPCISWIFVSKIMTGIFLGGLMALTSNLIAELTPVAYRGRIIMTVYLFNSFGSFYISILTIVLVPTFGWKWYLILAFIPMLITIPFVIWIPESPRYLLLVNRKVDAIHVLNRIAHVNNAQPIVDVNHISYKSSSFCELFHPNYRVTTLITTFLWFLAGLDFHIFNLVMFIINDIPRKCLQINHHPSYYFAVGNSSKDTSCCFPLTWSSMQTVFISVTGELLCYIFVIILINFLKRKPTMQIVLILNSIVFILLNLCLSPTYIGVVMLFGRGASVIMFAFNFLYASEVFPTAIRGFATGFGSSFLRLGSMASSLVVNIAMFKLSFLYVTIFLCVINVIGAISVFFLPYETKDRELYQTFDDNDSELKFLNAKY